MSIDVLRERVEAGMAATAAALPARGPKPEGWSERSWRMQGPFDHADVLPLASALGSTERPLFRAIFLAALMLLMLGGLNISGLMAARGLDRVRELSLRRALGATGPRIAWLVFSEALVLIAVGAAIGLSLAVPLLQVGLRLLPEDLVLLKAQSEPAIDARVVMFVLLSAFLLAVPTTIWPIRRALRTGATSLGDGGRGSTRTRSIGRTVVIVSQVAVALVLTTTGALLIASIMGIYANTPAIRTDGIVVLRERMQGPDDGKVGSAERTARINALIDTLRRVPGVDMAALTEGQLLDGGGGVPWWIPPPAAGPAASRLPVVAEAITSDFYRVLQPQFVMGRFPTDAELESGAPVIVVSESVARAVLAERLAARANADVSSRHRSVRRGRRRERRAVESVGRGGRGDLRTFRAGVAVRIVDRVHPEPDERRADHRRGHTRDHGRRSVDTNDPGRDTRRTVR